MRRNLDQKKDKSKFDTIFQSNTWYGYIFKTIKTCTVKYMTAYINCIEFCHLFISKYTYKYIKYNESKISRLKRKLFFETFDKLTESDKNLYYDQISKFQYPLVKSKESLFHKLLGLIEHNKHTIEHHTSPLKQLINNQFILFNENTKIDILKSLEDVGQKILNIYNTDYKYFLTYGRIYDEIENCSNNGKNYWYNYKSPIF